MLVKLLSNLDKVDVKSEAIGVPGSSPPPPSSSTFVNAIISIKLSAFWSEAAEVWFTQAQSVSKTKFYHTLAILP